ncbi:MAG: MBL fold metallo-hydrolase [Armatimonadota bacterium]|nr:MBL fold metallo-hydrolase [Armatimonadota bacterium]
MHASSSTTPLRARVLRSGSAGNAVLVETAGARVLIDAGLPADALLRALRAAGSTPLAAILLTHEHDDHARGAVALARATGAPIFLTAATLRACGESLAGVPHEVVAVERPFVVGGVEVTPFPVPHDAAQPVGFALTRNGTRVVVACDLGEVTSTVLDHARGADLLVIEANYDVGLLAVSPYPWFLKNRIAGPRGHLSNAAAARAAVAAATGRPQTVHLVHLSEVNNLAPLARDLVRAALEAEGLAAVRVEAVRPNAAGPWWPPGSTPAG